MKLKDIAIISTGYSFRSRLKHDPYGDTKIIQMSDADKYRGILVENLQRIANFNPRNDRYFLKPGDVIIISKGYNMDAFVIPRGLGRVVAVNSFVTLRVDDSVVSPLYLVWLLNSNRSQHYFKELAAGTNVPSLSIKALEALDINLPDMKQQSLIGEIEYLKKREIHLLQQITEKKERLVGELIQRYADQLNPTQKS